MKYLTPLVLLVTIAVAHADAPKGAGKRACVPDAEYSALEAQHADAIAWLKKNLRSPFEGRGKKAGHVCWSLETLEADRASLGDAFLDAMWTHADDLPSSRPAMRYDADVVAKYRAIKALPKPGMKGYDNELLAAARVSWTNAGLGQKVKRCVVTGTAWTQHRFPGHPLERSVRGVCVVETQPQVCVAFYDACRQRFLAKSGAWSVCAYEGRDYEAPKKIACPRGK